MSGRRRREPDGGPAAVVVSAVLRLYPAAWRERYAAELADLLSEQRLSIRDGVDLVRGALDAHGNLSDLIGRWSVVISKLRSTAVTTFTAWVVFCVAAGGLSKVTEDSAFAQAAQRHPGLALSHGVIAGAFTLSLVAMLVGGLPLAVVALQRAWRIRDVAMGRLVLVPVLAAASVTGYILLVTRAVSSAAPGVHSGVNIALFAGLVALGGAGTVGTVVAVRVAAHRAELPEGLLRLAGRAAVVAAGAISVGTAALAGYGWLLRTDEPELFRSASGLLATPLPASFLAILVIGLAAASTADRAALRGLRVLREAR